MAVGSRGQPDRDALVTEIDWISDNLAASQILVDRFLETMLALLQADGLVLRLVAGQERTIYLDRRGGPLAGSVPAPDTLDQDRFGAWLLERGAPVTLGDSDESGVDLSGLGPEGSFGSVAGIPVVQGFLSGYLIALRRPGEAGFSPRDLESATVLAEQLVGSLGSTLDVALQGKRVAQLSALVEMASAVNSTLDTGEVKRRAIRAVQELMGCEAASLLLLDSTGTSLEFDSAIGGKDQEVRAIRLRADEGVAGWVVQNDRHFMANSLEGVGIHSKRVDEATGFQTRELFAVPVRIGGKAGGCLQALNTRDGAGFRETDLRIFQALADQVGVAIQNAGLHEELSARLRQIQRQQEALIQSEKLSAMGQLSAGVAHEVRSPLSAISGYAQLLRRRFSDDDRLKKPLDVIEDACMHINRIVNGLLDFSRKDEPRYEPIPIDDPIQKALVLAEHTLNRYKGVEVRLDLAPGLPMVQADSRQLQQVFLNLMLNAAQAMPKGGRLGIRTFTEPAPGDESRVGRVVILFEDTGVGIPLDSQERVFQPFFTEGKQGGTGLGLSICRSIVQNHRGSITFTSRPGEGTTFRVQLPVDRGAMHA